jgi:hypothetical protein
MSDILKDLEPFLNSQISRLQSQLELEHTEIRTVPARSAPHADGRQKPSLSQLEKEEEIWLPRRLRL